MAGAHAHAQLHLRKQHERAPYTDVNEASCMSGGACAHAQSSICASGRHLCSHAKLHLREQRTLVLKRAAPLVQGEGPPSAHVRLPNSPMAQ